jgi:hypothetical protein
MANNEPVSDRARRMLRTGEVVEPQEKPTTKPKPNGAAHTAVDGPALLARVEEFIRKYVIMPEPAYLAVALWAVATHAVHEFDCFPYLAVLSAAKRSGKTRLAEALETLVREPWRATIPSPAALYRMLEKAPTLLLDEVEILNTRNKSETTQILLAVLNAGHRKGGFIPRCDGPRQEIRQFPVYGPKLFAGIGSLPDTLTDRSIVLHMKRRLRTQKVARFRQASAWDEAKPLRGAMERLARERRAEIGRAYQHVLTKDLEFLNDRDADLWTPLFAMCTLVAPERGVDLKQCAIVLSAAKSKDDVEESFALELLRDIKNVWPDGEAKIHTETLIHRLKAIPESPWADEKHPLTDRRLARMLRPFEVESRDVRISDTVRKGYHYEHLKAAFEPYLPDLSATSATEQ